MLVQHGGWEELAHEVTQSRCTGLNLRSKGKITQRRALGKRNCRVQVPHFTGAVSTGSDQPIRAKSRTCFAIEAFLTSRYTMYNVHWYKVVNRYKVVK